MYILHFYYLQFHNVLEDSFQKYFPLKLYQLGFNIHQKYHNQILGNARMRNFYIEAMTIYLKIPFMLSLHLFSL